MAFDLQEFLKTGYFPALRNLEMYLGADLESKLARQRHLQNIAETNRQYQLREQEARQGNIYEMKHHEADVEFEKLKDTMMRNHILEQTAYGIYEKRQGADIDIVKTKAEEEIKLAYKKEGYKEFTKSFVARYKEKPDEINEAFLNTVTKSVDALKKLQEMEDGYNDKLGLYQGTIDLVEGRVPPQRGQLVPSKQEVSEARKAVGYFQGQLKTIGSYKEALNNQMTKLSATGITDQGIVPPERRDLVLKYLDIFRDDFQQRRNQDIDELPDQVIIQGLSAFFQRDGIDVQLSPADIRFLTSALQLSKQTKIKK